MVLHNILKIGEISSGVTGDYKHLYTADFEENKMLNVYQIGEGSKTIVQPNIIQVIMTTFPTHVLIDNANKILEFFVVSNAIFIQSLQLIFIEYSLNITILCLSVEPEVLSKRQVFLEGISESLKYITCSLSKMFKSIEFFFMCKCL